MLRDHQLLQLTHDDTLVQKLIDEGKLTSAEAESHPQRSILIRALLQTNSTSVGRSRSSTPRSTLLLHGRVRRLTSPGAGRGPRSPLR